MELIRHRVWDAHDPPDTLRDAVRARDGTCRWPGCRQPAQRTDTDHTIPYPEGPTCLSNLGSLCRRHHLLKHATTWTVVQKADGIFEWISPTGQTYVTYPRGPTAPDVGADELPIER